MLEWKQEMDSPVDSYEKEKKRKENSSSMQQLVCRYPTVKDFYDTPQTSVLI